MNYGEIGGGGGGGGGGGVVVVELTDLTCVRFMK
jgi:hypothetical protein